MCECLSEYGSSAPLFLITSSGFSLATAGSSSACAVPKAETQHPFLPSKIATRNTPCLPRKTIEERPRVWRNERNCFQFSSSSCGRGVSAGKYVNHQGHGILNKHILASNWVQHTWPHLLLSYAVVLADARPADSLEMVLADALSLRHTHTHILLIKYLSIS